MKLMLFFSRLTLEKKILLVSVTPILTVLLNIKNIALGLALIILIDFLTGVRKSLHIKKIKFNPLKKEFWRCVKSDGMRKTWRKTYEYGIGIVVFALLESMILKLEPFTVLNMQFTLTELAVSVAAVVETYSVFENMEEVSGNNLLKTIIKVLKSPKTLFDKKK